jgi:hypothetical protein
VIDQYKCLGKRKMNYFSYPQQHAWQKHMKMVNKHLRNLAKFRHTENIAANQTAMKYVENI